jgi:tetratricopeptide (TPR) repeat protein
MRGSGWISCGSTLLTLALAADPLPAQRVRPAARLEELQRRAVTDSLDPAAHFNLAVGYMSRERWEAADSALRRALDLDPRFALAHLGLSVVMDGHGRFWRDLRRRGGDTAVAREHQRRDASLRRAFMFDPFVSLELLAYNRAMPRPLREMLAAGNFEDLFRATQNERAALMWFNKIEDNDSVPPGLLWINAMFAAQIGRDSVAMRDLGSLVRIMETREQHDSLPVPLYLNELRYTLAALYQRAGRLDDALVLFGRVAAEDIGAFMARVRRAQIYEQFRDWAAAARERRLAVEINPDDPTLARDLR